MPVNASKTLKPEDIINDVINTFMGALGNPPTDPKVTPTPPTVDPVSEVGRLLKKAEEVGPNEAATLLQIADRHIRIIESALAYQK